MQKYNFKNLVFEGGGIKGLAYAGAMEVLEEKGILKDIKRVAGTSAGAITATLIAIGYESKEIEKILSDADFKKFKDDSFFKTLNIIRLVKEYGWFKGDAFEKWFSELIGKKFKPNLTFKELYELKSQNTKELYVIGADVNSGKWKMFSRQTTPNMSIVKAVRISMSLPLFFKATSYEGDIFVDGGIYYNYPINLFDKKEYLDSNSSLVKHHKKNKYYNKETLGFRVDTPEEISSQKTGVENNKKKINSFKEYLLALVGSFLDLANKIHLSEFDWHRTVYIDALGISTTQFELSESLKTKIINQGKKDTQEYFKWFDKKTQEEMPLNK